MKFAKSFCITFLLSISLFCFAQIAFAAKDTGGLVPCGGDSVFANRCTLCDLIVGIRDIIKWGRSILIVVALLAIVAGAIMYIVSAGNSGMMESAKNVIKQALWGVVIVLGAWVIVNTVLWLMATNLSNVGISSWSDFDCEGGGSSTGTGGTTTCASFIYSTWGECQSDGTQFRNVINSSPTGCTGGSPVLTQSCTYTGSGECTSFTYSDWTLCTATLTTQSRIVLGRFPAGCTGGTPITSQPCPGAPTPPPATLSEDEARANLSTLSSGNISVWESSLGATNIRDLRQTSVDGVVNFQKEVGVPITVTGGAEADGPHSSGGTYSHANGYKVDIDDSPAVDNYIESKYDRIPGVRDDGAIGYVDNSGNTYYRETNPPHWDVTYK
ncbi:MAG: hypothetical protein ACWGHO_03390 [Candidatus Moraniibacteriota bacterium]